MKFCTKCKKEIPDKMIFCSSCGTKQYIRAVKTKICANCGKILPEVSDFCPACGSRYTGTERPAPSGDLPLIRISNCIWNRAMGLAPVSCRIDIYNDKLELINVNGQTVMTILYSELSAAADYIPILESEKGIKFVFRSMGKSDCKVKIPSDQQDFIPYVKAFISDHMPAQGKA